MGPRKEELVCTSRSQNRCIQQPGARWDESTKVYEMSSHPDAAMETFFDTIANPIVANGSKIKNTHANTNARTLLDND